MQLGRTPDELPVQGMLDGALDQHGRRLVHLVADNTSYQNAFSLVFLNIRAHSTHYSVPAAFSFNTVLILAISLRDLPAACGFTACVVADCMRRLNNSLRNSSRCCSSSAFVFFLSSSTFMI